MTKMHRLKVRQAVWIRGVLNDVVGNLGETEIVFSDSPQI